MGHTMKRVSRISRSRRGSSPGRAAAEANSRPLAETCTPPRLSSPSSPSPPLSPLSSPLPSPAAATAAAAAAAALPASSTVPPSVSPSAAAPYLPSSAASRCSAQWSCAALEGCAAASASVAKPRAESSKQP
eukprot:scaffold16255_cov69-Phaeocystis_antarctica.AAC.2